MKLYYHVNLGLPKCSNLKTCWHTGGKYIIILVSKTSKAFDSVNVEYIHKTFELFEFGENFRNWIKIIFKGGKSCISNNGHISQSFELKDQHTKVTQFLPLFSFFAWTFCSLQLDLTKTLRASLLKTMNSNWPHTQTIPLLILIQKNSKVSGLEINRSKSECLLLDYEMGGSSWGQK